MYPVKYGQYVLLERLGEGGMSVVDLGRKAGDDGDFVRFVVIKRIKTDRSEDEAFVRMFKDEARITSQLHHNNIAGVFDFGRHGDEYYMAMEYVPGLDVRQIMSALRKRKKGLPSKVYLRILVDVLKALDYAHRSVDQFGKPMAIVHRDVNPRNIMVSVRGEVKLIDFGVARANDRLERTQTDHVKGKFAYMAPEQVTATGIDGRADLFAIGITLYEFVMGKGPFRGLTQVQIVQRLITGQMPSLTRCPPELDGELLAQIAERALQADPERRYQSAADFGADLERLAETGHGLATQAELIAFLAIVDESLVQTINEKMHSYSGPLNLKQTAEHPALGEGVPSGASSVSGTFVSTPGGLAAAQGTGLVAGGLLLGGMFGVVLVCVLMVFAAGGYYYGNIVGPSNDAESPSAPAELDVTDEASPAAKLEPKREPVPVSSPAPSDGLSESPPKVRSLAPARVTKKQPPVSQKKTSKIIYEQPPSAVIEEGVPSSTDAPILVKPAPVVEPEPEVVLLYGTLQITSSPRGRLVWIDGEEAGRTPLQVSGSEGRHTVRVEGFSERTVDVHPHQRSALVFR